MLATCAAVLAGCNGPAGADGAPSVAASTQRSIQARWWEWAAAEPLGTNPVSDGTGEDCDRNQPDDVWFLAGTFGGSAQRRCTVPLGVALVAPAIDFVGGDQAACTAFMADATGTIEVDGTALSLDRIDGEPITFITRQGNPVTETSGRTRGIGCGLWARINPPSAGEHTVRIHGESGSFVVDAEYTLVVSATRQSAA